MAQTTSSAKVAMIYGASALGQMIPPLYVFASGTNEEALREEDLLHASFFTAEEGKVTAAIKLAWLTTTFLPFLKQQRALHGFLDAVLIADRDATHLQVDFIRSCREHQIHLLIPSETSTSFLQPLHETVVPKINAVLQRAEITTPLAFLKSHQPAALKAFSTDAIVNGFVQTGAWPLSESVVREREARGRAAETALLALTKKKKREEEALAEEKRRNKENVQLNRKEEGGDQDGLLRDALFELERLGSSVVRIEKEAAPIIEQRDVSDEWDTEEVRKMYKKARKACFDSVMLLERYKTATNHLERLIQFKEHHE